MSGPAKGTPWTETRREAQNALSVRARGTLVFKTHQSGSSWFGQFYVGGKQVRRKLGDGSLTRDQAQVRLDDLTADRLPEQSSWELVTQRQADCLTLLRTLAGIVTVRLTPSAFAIFATQGYGADIVRAAVQALVRSGLAEIRWEAAGLRRVPVLRGHGGVGNPEACLTQMN